MNARKARETRKIQASASEKERNKNRVVYITLVHTPVENESSCTSPDIGYLDVRHTDVWQARDTAIEMILDLLEEHGVQRDNVGFVDVFKPNEDPTNA